MSERTFEPIDAEQVAAAHRSGRTLRSLAESYGVSRSTIHRLIVSTGRAVKRTSGEFEFIPSDQWNDEPVADYGDRFAHSGRCGACLRADCAGGSACSPVRLSSLGS